MDDNTNFPMLTSYSSGSGAQYTNRDQTHVARHDDKNCIQSREASGKRKESADSASSQYKFWDGGLRADGGWTRMHNNLAASMKREGAMKPKVVGNQPKVEVKEPQVGEGMTVVKHFHRENDFLMVSAADLNSASRILEKHGRIVICGYPGSGKSLLGLSLLQVFHEKGYTPLDHLGTYDVCNATHFSMQPGTEEMLGFVALVDDSLGRGRLNREAYNHCLDFIFTTQRLWDRPRPRPVLFPSLLIITLCPHTLKEVQVMDEGAMFPLADREVLFHLTQDPRCPSRPFIPNVDSYHRLITAMLQAEDQSSVVNLLALMMIGEGDFLSDIHRTQEALVRLGITHKSCFQLAEAESFLRGILLVEEGVGFLNRTVYEAAGLAMSKSYALGLALRVCDPLFIAKYMRFDPDAARTEICVAVSSFKGIERDLVLQKVFEGMTDHGNLMELCQHPSLAYLNVVEEFVEFCENRKNYTERLLSAVDSCHGLSLLYWSAWSSSTHLNCWCLNAMKTSIIKAKALTESLLVSLLACILFAESGDSTQGIARTLVKELANMKHKPPRECLELTLPAPAFFENEARVRKRQVMTRLKSRLHFLEDYRLPIPPTVLTAKMHEEGVQVRMLSKCWYLVLRLLTDCDRDDKDDKGNTALHLAVEADQEEVVHMIVQSGSSLLARNRKGATPVSLAGKRMKSTFTGKEARLKESDSFFRYLYMACDKKDENMVKVLLCQGLNVHGRDEEDNTPIYLAAKSGLTDTVSLMLQLEADPNSKNKEGRTPLHEACMLGNLDMATSLVEHKADVNAKSRQGATPLHFSCSGGHTEVTGLLISRGVDVNVKDKNKLSPLYLACQKGFVDVVHLLLKKRADINAKNGAEGATALHAASHGGHAYVVDLLRLHGAHGGSVTPIEGQLVTHFAARV